MQTQQIPISQIVSPNSTPGPANRSDTPSASDGDFQRALDRQLEQRQLSRNAAQAQVQQAPAPVPAPVPAQQTQQTQQAQVAVATPADAAKEAATPAANAKDSASKEEAPADAPPATAQQAVIDPAAAMLALVSSIKLAMQQPVAGDKTLADAGATQVGAKAGGKNLTAAQLLAGQTGKTGATSNADAGDFADTLGQVQQGKTAATALPGATTQAAKADADAGKLAIDTQLAASVKNGATLAEALPKETASDLSRLTAQLQPASLQQAAAAAAVPTDKLMGRVGTPAWDQQLGQKVVWMAAGGDQSATLTLNPPDLGPLKVVLTVTNDQANAAFMSAQPEVRHALEAAMPRLREMMSEAGIAFGNASVSAGTQEQQNNGNRETGGDGRRGDHRGGMVSSGEIAIAPATGSRSRASLSAVDTFA